MNAWMWVGAGFAATYGTFVGYVLTLRARARRAGVVGERGGSR